MENTQYIKPDVLFEVSWEVCNKVGGIYTVLASKYLSVKDSSSDKYIFIGPDVWKETRENPDFVEDKTVFKAWVDQAEKEGLRLRIGYWNIPGKPLAILVNFTPLFAEKDKIFASLWETYKLDSLTGGWDYTEPALFGYAAGKTIHSFYNFYVRQNDIVLAHFHEWMTGAGILYLKKNAPQIGTIFTTHATTLGRSMTSNNVPFYKEMESIIPSEMAKRLQVVSKQSLELNAAAQADVFTTVSDITAIECKYLLQKEVDVITPNGFSGSFAPKDEEFDIQKAKSRAKIIHVTEAILNQKIKEDALLVLTSGRYEFRNKGLDAFIDALANLNQSSAGLNRQIVGIIAVPGNHAGPDPDVVSRLNNQPDFKQPLTNKYLSHLLRDKFHDPNINRILEKNLNNGAESKVKIIFVPVYLDGKDGVFNQHYYEFLNGFDLTVFPSVYEPWGYTPLESIAFRIPTITTTLAGFGLWVAQKYKTPESSVSVLNRTENNYDEFVRDITQKILFYSQLNEKSYQKTSEEAYKISDQLHWNILAAHYTEAYKIAEETVRGRAHKFQMKTTVDFDISEADIKEKPGWKRFYIRSRIPEELEPLKELSMNLWWCWNYKAAELFESIDPQKWEETGHNPVALLNNLSFEKLKTLKSDLDFMQMLEQVYSSFKAYMELESQKPSEKVGYFSMEFGLHESLKTYSGGLGILAGDYLKEASDSNKNLVGIGLMYRYGYFSQSLSIFGDQNADSKAQKYTDLPLHPVRNDDDTWVKISIAMPGRTLYAKVWQVKVGRINLYLLDADIEENSMEDRSITHHLYGGDWHNRFKQELLLGVGGVRFLFQQKLQPDIYHLNEGHAAFAGLERLRQMVEDHAMNFKTALEYIRGTSLFTTHTPVPAGHDTFTEDILRAYIPHYADRLNISWEQFMDLGKFHPGNPHEKFSMSVLAANLSQEMNGVSKIHGRVSREMFVDLYKGYFPEELHIGHVTNGVHYPTWANGNIQNFYLNHFGQNHIHTQSNPETWKKIINVPDTDIWDQRKKAKSELIQYLRKKHIKDLLARQETPSFIYKTMEGILEDALYIGFARRFATYKRAHLLFTNLEKLEEITNSEKMPVRFLFAGKAHPNDRPGQDLIKRIYEISKLPQFIGKIIFLENYDMGVARKLVSGVDIWLNTPTRPLEASGTSGEKAVMNGVLNFSVLDGWWAEGYKQNAGWAIQESKTYGNQSFQDELDAEIIYRFLEEEIMPLYFDRDKQGLSHGWVGYIKNNIAGIAPHFTMQRMLNDYYEKFYSTLFERRELLRKDDFKLAREIKKWKQDIESKWNDIDIKGIRLPDSSINPIDLGEDFEVEVRIDTNGVKPENIGVDIVLGQKEIEKITKIYKVIKLNLTGKKDADSIYSCKLNIADSGVFDFAFRIYPEHELLPHRQDFCLVRWI
ncbi:MAG: alpha-glucan family phosphorylase [Bacteroidales bacterium]|nr:alpha-glucan family phosphorylase [Bacteroidales bacterium]MCF8404316.1 alpha-glucan family phosphorylase [Bacteroidales bacterium]